MPIRLPRGLSKQRAEFLSDLGIAVELWRKEDAEIVDFTGLLASFEQHARDTVIAHPNAPFVQQFREELYRAKDFLRMYKKTMKTALRTMKQVGMRALDEKMPFDFRDATRELKAALRVFENARRQNQKHLAALDGMLKSAKVERAPRRLAKPKPNGRTPRELIH